MGIIAGASKFTNAAILANKQGRSAATDNLAARIGSDLLAAGRSLAIPGLGVSGAARQLNAQQISQSKGLFNGIFSAGATATTKDLQTQVLALRASLPTDNVIESLRFISEEEASAQGGVDITA